MLNHAIQLMSKHPGVRLGGPFEICPAHERINALVLKLYQEGRDEKTEEDEEQAGTTD